MFRNAYELILNYPESKDRQQKILKELIKGVLENKQNHTIAVLSTGEESISSAFNQYDPASAVEPDADLSRFIDP